MIVLSKKSERNGEIVLVEEVDDSQLQAFILDYIHSEKKGMDKTWFKDFLMELHRDLSEILDVPVCFERKHGKMTLRKNKSKFA